MCKQSIIWIYYCKIRSDPAFRHKKICNLVSNMRRIIVSTRHNVSWCVFSRTVIYQYDWLLWNRSNICSSHFGKFYSYDDKRSLFYCTDSSKDWPRRHMNNRYNRVSNIQCHPKKNGLHCDTVLYTYGRTGICLVKRRHLHLVIFHTGYLFFFG